MAMFMAIEQFFAKYIGGRYQKDARAEVTARLKAIMVDPQTLREKPSDTKLPATPGHEPSNPK
jgi:hypothetical protein